MNFNKLELKPACILSVPLKKYAKDFLFIVNDEEFRTSRIIADLLSPIISKLHISDPTIDNFTINTNSQGNFSQILSLIEFNEKQFSDNEIPFILEVIEILGNESIEYQEEIEDLTVDNVFKFIKKHEKFPKFYSKQLSIEIDLISSHFNELCEKQERDFLSISIDTLISILNSNKLQLDSEDQLLKFVNKIYHFNSKYSMIYETVIFENATPEMMSEFISLYDVSDINKTVWNCLSKRLEKEIKIDNRENCIQKVERRYKEIQNKGLIFPVKENEFDGILNYLKKISNDETCKEVNIESYSVINDCQPRNVVLFDRKDMFLETLGLRNDEWLRFDFRDRRVIPTGYTIMSYPYNENSHHPRLWVIEGSIDNAHWEILDKQDKERSELRGTNKVHTFNMNHQSSKEFRFIRMRLTGKNWLDQQRLALSCFELYGTLL